MCPEYPMIKETIICIQPAINIAHIYVTTTEVIGKHMGQGELEAYTNVRSQTRKNEANILE